jgi:hypothetical protein
VEESGGLTLYERPRSGSSLREYKAIGIIAAEPAVVKRVIDDVEEYPKFMPYVAEIRVLSSERNSRVTYQRLSPPIIGDRDYTVRVNYEIRRGPAGLTFCNRWKCANDSGPAERKGVTRVKVVEGSWLLEPSGTDQTRATYAVFSDAAGAMPAMIANAAGKAAIPRVFASIRKQVQLAKYRTPR